MQILLYKKPKDSDLTKGQTVCYKDTNGQFTLTGAIAEIQNDTDGTRLYSITGATGVYMADELRLSVSMENEYCVVSKQTRNNGRTVLVSFASKPMWKNYEQLRRENQTAGTWSIDIAEYAIKKYANKGDYEILPSDQITAEVEKYKNDFPNWQ